MPPGRLDAAELFGISDAASRTTLRVTIATAPGPGPLRPTHTHHTARITTMDNSNTFSRRSFLTKAAAAAGTLALPSVVAACGSSSKSSSNGSTSKGGASSTRDDVITVGLPVVASQFKSTLAYLDAFTKSTGITINPFTTNTPSGSWVAVFQELSTRLAGGEALDTAYIATEGMLLFEEQNLLTPLDSYIAGDSAAVNSFNKDVNPQLLNHFRTLDDIKGHTYFIPIGYNVMSMWYNRTLFKQMNVPEPGPGWTWDEFESAAAKIAAPPNRYGYAIGTPVPGPFTDVYPWVLTNGGQILNSAQTACVANNPQAIEAAAFVRSLVTKKLVNEPGGAYDPFVTALADRLGMFGGGIWPNTDIAAPQATINDKFAIVPWPKKTQGGTPVGLGGFPMFAGSKKKAAVWEFIKYSFSEEFQQGPVVSFAGDVPIRTSAATNPAFLKKYPPGTSNFSTELSESTLIVGVPNGSAVESEISTAWEQILSGGTSPAAGMKAMQDSCTTLMAQKVG
jgi:multiple sugar transport system substrate-binding protein